LTFTAALLAFYFTSSALTKLAGSIKQAVDSDYKQGGQRDWRQVLCNALVPTALALAYGIATSFTDYPLGAMCGPLCSATSSGPLFTAHAPSP